MAECSGTSRLAQLLMVDCLFVGLAKQRPGESLEALDKTLTTLATRRV